MIHDLRQPLAAMQIWVDLLAEGLRGKIGEREERYLAQIRSELERMAALLASRCGRPAAAHSTPSPTCAGERVIALGARLPLRLGGQWDGTSVEVPPGRWRDELGGNEIEGGTQPLEGLLGRLPVALLVRTDVP